MGIYRYISAEEIPAKYGGLSKEGEFEAGDSVTEILVKPSSNHIVEIPVNKVRINSFFNLKNYMLTEFWKDCVHWQEYCSLVF